MPSCATSCARPRPPARLLNDASNALESGADAVGNAAKAVTNTLKPVHDVLDDIDAFLERNLATVRKISAILDRTISFNYPGTCKRVAKTKVPYPCTYGCSKKISGKCPGLCDKSVRYPCGVSCSWKGCSTKWCTKNVPSPCMKDCQKTIPWTCTKTCYKWVSTDVFEPCTKQGSVKVRDAVDLADDLIGSGMDAVKDLLVREIGSALGGGPAAALLRGDVGEAAMSRLKAEAAQRLSLPSIMDNLESQLPSEARCFLSDDILDCAPFSKIVDQYRQVVVRTMFQS